MCVLVIVQSNEHPFILRMKKAFIILARVLLGIIAILVLVFAIFFLSTMGGSHRVPLTAEVNADIPQVSVNDVVFHLEAYGNPENPAIIVLHGGPGNDFAYLLPLAGLSDQYYIVFYDQRGSGLSQRVEKEQISLEAFYSDLDEIVDLVSGGRKVHLIGHSWGGMLASGYLGKHPEKIDKIVLAEPGFLTPEFGKELFEKANGFEAPASLNALYYLINSWFHSLHVHGPDEQARQDYFMMKLVRSPIKGHPMARYFCNQDISTCYMPMVRFGSLVSSILLSSQMDANGYPAVNFVEGVENYPDTVLFLSGECNTLIGPDYQEKQMQLFSRVRHVIINDAGHTMIGEKPEESIAAIRNYFAR